LDNEIRGWTRRKADVSGHSRFVIGSNRLGTAVRLARHLHDRQD
jgi:hypothetical protein